VSLGQEESHPERGGEERQQSPAQEAFSGTHHCIFERKTIERYFLKRGHTVLKTDQDYGVDLMVYTHDQDGYVEAGNIYIQLKATDAPRISDDRTFYSLSVSIKHYNAWLNEAMPVFLILCDAKNERAYWQYVQGYFEGNPALRPKKGAASITVRLPVANEFNEDTVEYVRSRKEAVLDQVRGAVNHEL
jgi:hypothetical protein